MGRPGVGVVGYRRAVALAVLLLAGGRRIPARPVRYLVLWRDVRGVLDRYGVGYEARVYRTTVAGREYRRYKIIIRDLRVTRLLARLSDPKKLRRVLWRYRDVVRDVVTGLRYLRASPVFRALPWKWLNEWFGVKPYNPRVYFRHRDKAIVKLIKPNWRKMFYVMRIKAQEAIERYYE